MNFLSKIQKSRDEFISIFYLQTLSLFHPSPFSDAKPNFYPLHLIGFHIKQTTPYLRPKPYNSIELLILHEVGLLLISDKQKLNRYENIRQTGVRDSASLVSPANIQNRQHGRSLYARLYRDHRPLGNLQAHFAGTLRGAERGYDARPRNALCPP